ncbi:MAG: hypothetical protein ACLQBB_00135 [Solirubrobacteraceae bacterium]
MFGRTTRSRLLRLGALVALMAVAGGIAAAALPDDDDAQGRATASRAGRDEGGAAPCGTATAGTVLAVDRLVASRIYSDELRGGETREDAARIASYRPLLRALAARDSAAVHAAVHALVYRPHWHIVRLRVARGGRVLADVGGPYVIAPVSGQLRWQGRVVGRYVASVQDDVGYVKLVRRFIGAPVDLYHGGSFLMGNLRPAPSPSGNGSRVNVGGQSYLLRTFQAGAFPTGALQIALFAPQHAPALAASSCNAVRLATWGAVATHIAARFHPLRVHYQALADLLRAVTGGHVYVRAGSIRLAGGSGPGRLPTHGSVRLGGRSWPVFSWEPVPTQRVYFLTPGG